MKKLTVTIPSYRQPELLSRALVGLSKQTWKDFNVVILDDASGLDLDSVCAPYRESLDILIVRNEKNLGAMENMLASITHETESPYILSHHEDDYLKKNYLEKAVKILDAEKDISFVITTPEWIHRDEPYKEDSIRTGTYAAFNDSQFVHDAVTNKPFIFGSVVYRRSHLILDWEYDTYATFCDRFFLASILDKHNTMGALIVEPGICVRDHSQDTFDNRAKNTTEDHAIALYSFYKSILSRNRPKRAVSKLITNGLLFTYSNFPSRSSFSVFYKKQKKDALIDFSSLTPVGIFSLMTMSLSQTFKRNVRKWIKRIIKPAEA